jgi:hypothetical protein
MNTKSLIAIGATTASLLSVVPAHAGGIGFHFSVGIGGRSQKAVEQPPVYVVQQAAPAAPPAVAPAVTPAAVPATPAAAPAAPATPTPVQGSAAPAPAQAPVQVAPSVPTPAPGTTVYPGGTTVVGNQVVYTPVSPPPPQNVYTRRSWGVGPFVDTGFRWGQHYYPPAGHSY